MITGWRVVDGVYYYFNPVSDGHRGRMYADEMTPDGYYVDQNGKWVP
jgi:glucan-binding YG repeat protein